MAPTISARTTKWFLILLTLTLSGALFAQTDVVNTYQDNNGWKLQVNGEDYFVKGMVWSYTPIGENYSYNLWAKPDDYIKDVLDYECNLMKAAGVNTVRQFAVIPPRWITYMYEEHGIRTIVNFLMGRYGYNVGGVWLPQTNYSDPLTRETLQRDFVEIVETYKDVPGVLMFALGNENNYGLEWSSFEIENLPEGERHREKAKFLYSLYNETIEAAKQVDRNHPFAIVNGDIQYIDLVRDECPALDILGVNAYRGVSFTDMWERAHKELGLPVMLTEFGSDAFNALEDREEQEGQAAIAYGNWSEIYRKSYGKGEEGNAIGGCYFEWRDEWWKFKQTENLEIQDRHASWSNGGYSFDFEHGVNNMNEEWFGVCRLGEPNDDGVSIATPRMAYDVLRAIWSIDPYKVDRTEMDRWLSSIDMDFLAMRSSLRTLQEEQREDRAFRFTGGKLQGDLAFNGLSEDIEEDGKDGVSFTNGEMLFLDFAFQPTRNIDGTFTLNILGNTPDLPMEQYYGKRGENYVSVTTETDDSGVEVETTKEITDNERIEIYSFEANYTSDDYDFTAFYHVPRFHWVYEGDFFGLMREATDMEGMDIWNAKAPYGVEFTGHKALEGLKIVTGPEIYWGANPKAILKYQFGGGHFDWTVIHSEDFTQAEASATATEATERTTRQSALSVETDIIPGATLELGYLIAGTEKIDDEFQYMEDDVLYTDEIEFQDTQSARAKLSFLIGSTLIDVSAQYAGLVADGGAVLVERESTLPHSDLGNKLVYEGGLLIPIGNVWLLPRGLYRTNLIDAMSATEPYVDDVDFYPGTSPRNRDDDPFAVLDNREAAAGEFFITYDPTPASSFYDWDRDWKEDAPLAFTVGGSFTSYTTDTDSYLFYYQEGATNAPFGVGLPKEDVWTVKGHFIMNPNANLHIVASAETGKQQSTGNPEGDAAEFYSLSAKFVMNQRHVIDTYVKKDAWGPYDWYRQFNITYPWQAKLDYSILIDNFLDDSISSRLGCKALFRTLDENSPINESGADNDYEFQTGVYYQFNY